MDDEAEKFLGNETVMRKEICAETTKRNVCRNCTSEERIGRQKKM